MNHFPRLTDAFAKCSFFFYSSPDREGISYKGPIDTIRWGELIIEFYFPNKALTSFPKAFLLDKSIKELQPYHFPHIDHEWLICYDDGIKVFDRYKPNEMVLYCINQVRMLLDEIQENDMDEIIPEFASYWIPKKFYDGDIEEGCDCVYEISQKMVSSKNNLWKLDIKSSFLPIPIFSINSIPEFKFIKWPMDDLLELKKWLIDYPDVFLGVQQYVRKRIRSYYKESKIVIYSIKEKYYFGLNIIVKSNLLLKKGKPSLQNSTVESILKKGTKIKSRFWIENYTPEKIITANSEQSGIEIKNLCNKKILLIGVGTVGSNLANLLVRNGAGTGESGILSIIDNDIYETFNFSRHFLGLNSSNVNKVYALKEELNRIAPFCNIDPINKSIIESESILEKHDIIIDSTGEEAITMWLNELLYDSSSLFLSVWIRGSGEVVEAFIIDDLKICHECFRISTKKNNNSLIEYPIRGSCGSVYIPFSINASLYAGLITMEILRKWLNSELSQNNFFKQHINPVKEIEACKIQKHLECPVCGKNCSEG